MTRNTLCLVALATLSPLACASTNGGAFGLAYPASSAGELAAVEARARAAAAPMVPAVAVVVPPAPARGFAMFALPTGARTGQVGVAIVGRPVIAGDLVLARSPGSIVAWGLDGRERWRVPDRGFSLVGASQDAGRVAITLGGAGVTRRSGALLVVDAETGAPQLQRPEAHAFGAPLLVGRDLYVPWDGQNLSVFDADRGAELARVRTRDDVFGFARREGPTVWLGARALYRFGADMSAGRSAAATRVAFSRDGLPGAPPFMADPYVTLNAGLDARERVRLAWRPDSAAQGATFAGGAVYSLFHRDVFALDAATGAVRWAYVHPADVAGIEVSRGGVTLVDENGRAALLDAASGRVCWRANLDTPSAQAVLQVPGDFAPSGGADDEPARSQVEGLLLAAGGTDTRLMPAQLFAVRALTEIESPEATHALVTVLTRRLYPQELRAAAGEAITHRTNGTEAMLEALGAHHDYVRDVTAPPVGMLARGLAAARERRAVPALIAHLQDPATAASDLPQITAALRELGDAAAVAPLVDFLRLYHADSGMLSPVGGGEAHDDRHVGEQEPLDAALEQAVLAVGAMGGATERRVLDEIATHPRTATVVRDAIARVSAGDTRTAQASATAASQGGGIDMAFHMPTRLNAEAVETAYLPVRPQLLECLRNAPSRPSMVRIQFRYDSAGAVSHATINPTAFQACMAPLIEAVRLPENSAGRDIATYNLSTLP